MTEAQQAVRSFDSDTHRKVLGRVPTGVTVITCATPDGERHGLVVGSFTSLSLEPPLVAFMPAKTSTTFPRIAEAGTFCVNVLAADQAEVCRSFFGKDPDRFDRWSWSTAATGSPVLDDASAWIDCELESTYDGGDHHIVVGRILDLGTRADTAPLVFLSGGYGSFSGHSLTAWRDATAVEQLRYADLAREQMQRLSRVWGVETLAVIREDTDMMVLASTGSERSVRLPSRVGLRLPIVPPMGAMLVAWDEPEWRAWWLAEAAPEALDRQALQEKLDLVRARGFSLVLNGADEFDELVRHQSVRRSPDIEHLRPEIAAALEHTRWEPRVEDLDTPAEVRTVSVPVCTPDGALAFMLTVFRPGMLTPERIVALTDDLRAAADEIAARIKDASAPGTGEQ